MFYQHYDFVPLENAVRKVCYISGEQVQVLYFSIDNARIIYTKKV